MASRSHDLIVIGAGSAGIPAARFAASLGVRVALVEAERVGGDCTWTGCVPSKALLHAARIAHLSRTAAAYGLPRVEAPIDLGAVMSAVRGASERVYGQESPERLAAEGIEVILAAAHFLDPHTLEAGDRRLSAGHFLISTGAEPSLPVIPGLDRTPHLTYRDVFQMTSLPLRLLVLGGGPVGVELAQAFSRLGSAVTVIEAEDRLLPGTEPELGELLSSAFQEEGIEVRLNVKVEDASELSGGTLLVASGRRPRLEGLDLERAGVKATPEGIEVDDQLRSSQSHIYAAGDCTGGPQFTHYAGYQGFQAVRNALLPGSTAGKKAGIPWAVFTDPEIAQAGQSAAAARSEAERVERHRWPIEQLDRAQAAGERHGYIEVVARAGTVVGATVVGTAAGEIINELALAIDHGLKLTELARTIHVYPSYGFGVQQLAAEAAVAAATAGLSGRVIRRFAR